MRSAKAPQISAGVMMAKVIWKHHEHRFGDRALAGVADVHALQEEARHAADIGVHAAAVGEGERVADHHPQHGDEAGDGEALHDGGEHVLLAHHAAVEQRQARDGHHQHQSGGCQHPRRVAGAQRWCGWCCRRASASWASAGSNMGKRKRSERSRPRRIHIWQVFIFGLPSRALIRWFRRCGCAPPARRERRRSCRRRSVRSWPRRRWRRRPCRPASAGTTTSILIFGRKFTAYSAPR